MRVGADLAEVMRSVSAALAGTGPAVLPRPAGADLSVPDHDPQTLPDDLAVVVGTSGSTGAPKLALLTATALRASAAATADRLGGTGDWLLALPAHHVAGMQVVVRAVCGGGQVVASAAGPFTVGVFVAGTAALSAGGAGRRYTSLVPTQLARLVADPAGVAALAAYDAVLVGGAACPVSLLTRARELGVPVVTTYGSSETCGGCVYDGLPLSGIQLRLEGADELGVGRIWVGGPVVASGYLGDPVRSAAAFPQVEGQRWYRTDDLGRIDPSTGRVQVWGRADDVIVSGGMKVSPRVVEEAVASVLPAGWTAVVVGIPDSQWGQLVGLAVAPQAAADTAGEVGTAASRWVTGGGGLEMLREELRDALPRYALPRVMQVWSEIPLIGVGKPDRAAVLRRLSAAADTMTGTDMP
ncbi:putative 2-succinylbenzoate--CoA ligase [Austwickia sp. TVS 96-490-7B]|nr:putative 2-succinylbenzoate--CoA ligase [Austwickia sp. TVS 96-490-7B]